jgi:peroxiredoxin Q/BCP
MSLRTHFAAAIAVSALAATAGAQQPAAAAPRTPPPAVGAVAPDFTLPGATRYGVLQKPASLSDYKGKTVVLAFFFRARTRG